MKFSGPKSGTPEIWEQRRGGGGWLVGTPLTPVMGVGGPSAFRKAPDAVLWVDGRELRPEVAEEPLAVPCAREW